MIDNLSTIHCVGGGTVCGCFYPRFELPAVVPAANSHALGVLWQEPGHSLVAFRSSSDVKTWLSGKSRVVPNRPPSRKHCPNLCPAALSESPAVNGSLSAPLKGGWARDICGFFTRSELSQGRKDREVLKVFPNAGKSQSKFRTTSKDDSSVLSDLCRGNLSRLKSWCAPFTLVGCRELGLEFPKRN